MTSRQVLVIAVVLGLVCAMVVWWLDRWNVDRMVAKFHTELEQLPTFRREGETGGA